MNKHACARAWEVEAARDGLLEASALEAHRTHVAGCEICRREQTALAGYFDAVSHVGEHVDRLKLRRIRNSVLARVRTKPSTPPWRRLGRALVVGAAFAAALLLFVMRSRTNVSAPIAVTARGDAQWQRKLEAHQEKIVLTGGTLRFHVTHAPDAPRLIVVVPDGEIEDIGTTFSVTVERSHTTRIAVDEGCVVFHRPSEPDLRLIAGSEWSRPRAERTTVADSMADEASGSSLSQGAREPHTRTSTSPRRPARRASTGLTEDQAYFRIIEFRRSGQLAQAETAAHAYLRTFPSGFRRPEVLRLVHEIAERDASP